MFTAIGEMLRPEPILRLRPYIDPRGQHERDSDSQREWDRNVKANNKTQRAKARVQAELMAQEAA